MKYLTSLCVTVLGLMSCFNPTAHGAVITINPSTDGHIRASGSSFGTDAILVGMVDAADFLNGVFAFDLSAVPNGMQVDSVSLTLYSATADSISVNAPVTFNLYELLHDVSDSTTWTQYSPGNNWQVAGAYGATDRGSSSLSSLAWNPRTPSPPRGTEYEFASSAAFATAANSALAGDGILNLWLGLNTSETGRHIARLVGSEDPGSYDPVLTISYSIPEPSVALLLAGGLSVLMIRNRKR